MRIVEVDPGEESVGLRPAGKDPIQRRLQHFIRAPLHDFQIGAAANHPIVVSVEAAVQTESRVQYE